MKAPLSRSNVTTGFAVVNEAPISGVARAVNVTFWPYTDGFAEETREKAVRADCARVSTMLLSVAPAPKVLVSYWTVNFSPLRKTEPPCPIGVMVP